MKIFFSFWRGLAIGGRDYFIQLKKMIYCRLYMNLTQPVVLELRTGNPTKQAFWRWILLGLACLIEFDRYVCFV